MTSLASRVVDSRETMIRYVSCAGLMVGCLFGCEPEKVPTTTGTGTTKVGTSASSGSTPLPSDALPPDASAGTHRAVLPPMASVSASSSTGEKKARYVALSTEEVTKLVLPHLSKEAVAHPPHRGPFGPSFDTIVVITKKHNGDFGGFVLVTRGGETKKTELPILQESWPGVSVEALGFVSECDGDTVEELVVISKHRAASSSTTVATVIDFDGAAFRRLGDVEALTAKGKTIRDVRETLKTRTFLLHVDGVPIRILPTLRPHALAAHLEKLMGVKPKARTDEQVWFNYAEKPGQDPAQFIFTFNRSKVLTKIVVGAAGEKGDSEKRNPTGNKLATWLEANAGAGKVEGSKTTWKYNGWVFALDKAKSADGDHHTLEIRPR
jgi:hypothetical protein